MKLAVSALISLLPLCGCGIQPQGVLRDCADGSLCPGAGSGSAEFAGSTGGAEAGSAWQSPGLLIPSETEDDTTEPPEQQQVFPLPPTFPALDPFALAVFTSADVSALLSGLLDNLVFDLLDPVPSNSDFTYLELLCIGQDEPEFLCRQRFGR